MNLWVYGNIYILKNQHVYSDFRIVGTICKQVVVIENMDTHLVIHIHKDQGYYVISPLRMDVLYIQIQYQKLMLIDVD